MEKYDNYFIVLEPKKKKTSPQAYSMTLYTRYTGEDTHLDKAFYNAFAVM